MLEISQILNSKRVSKPNAPPHELAASVDEIQRVLGFKNEGKYGYRYWLGKVKCSKKSYTEILGVLKSLEGMDKKYNKGGRLTNILSGKK